VLVPHDPVGAHRKHVGEEVAAEHDGDLGAPDERQQRFLFGPALVPVGLDVAALDIVSEELAFFANRNERLAVNPIRRICEQKIDCDAFQQLVHRERVAAVAAVQQMIAAAPELAHLDLPLLLAVL
jgi:hypothetical protein